MAAPRHLQLVPSGSGVSIECRDQNRTKLVDGRKMPERLLVTEETVFRIGEHELRIDARKDPFEETTELDDALSSVEAHLACVQSFHCPKRWTRLTPTADPTHRHCGECRRDVYLVWTEELYNRHTQLGHVAAIMAGEPLDTGFDSETTFRGEADDETPQMVETFTPDADTEF